MEWVASMPVDPAENPFSTRGLPRDPVSNRDAYLEKQERNEGVDWLDRQAAFFRQGSIIQPLINTYHGNQFYPEEGYSAYENDEQWKKDTAGIPVENHKDLLDSTSRAQFEHRRDVILKNQRDMQIIADSGLGDHALALLSGFVYPENLALMAASGGLSTVLQGSRLARTAQAVNRFNTAVDVGEVAAARAAFATEKLANLQKSGSLKTFGKVLGVAAVENMSVEQLRQHLNFESNRTQVLMAGIYGLLMSAPFAFAGTVKANRLMKAASLDKEVADILKHSLDTGTPPSPAELKVLESHEKLSDAAMKLELGEISKADYDKAWAEYEAGFKNRKGSDEAWAEYEAGVLAKREKELGEIQRAGQMAAGDEMAAVMDSTDAVNSATGRPYTAMEQAFAKAMGTELPPVDANGLYVRERTLTTSELIGGDVFWFSEEGSGVSRGMVIGELDGKLRVEERSTGDLVLIDREDLHPRSPGYPVEDPSELPPGFLRGSIGAGQVGEVKLAESVMKHMTLGFGKYKVKIPIRFDWYATLDNSKNEMVRLWTSRLVKDPIGSEGFVTQGRTISEDVRLQQRVVAGGFHMKAQAEFNKASQKRKLNLLKQSSFRDEFYEMVTAVSRGDKKALSENADIAPELLAASKAQREVLDTILDAAKKAGVKGAENVSPDEFYINRVYSSVKITNMMNSYGPEQVYSLVANSFTDSKLHGNVKKAESFLEVIRRAQHDSTLQDLLLAPRDMTSVRNMLAEGGFSKQEIDNFVDVMFEIKEAAKGTVEGDATNLKFRMPMDELYEEVLPDGSVLKITDILENDSRILVDRYVHSMAGHTAWAKNGIKSKADFEKFVIKPIEDYHKEHNLGKVNESKLADEITRMRDIYAFTTGRPMSTQVFNKTSRIISALQAYSRSGFLGQLGLPALGELKQTVALSSLRALMMQCKGMRGLWHALRKGVTPDDQLTRDIIGMNGFGTEIFSAYARQNEFTDATYDRGLTKLENLANKASHGVDKISGNASITSGTRILSSRAFIQELHLHATGRHPLTQAKKHRLAHAGIELDEMGTVMEHLKKYTVADDIGTVEHIEWENWSKENLHTYEQFNLAIERLTRDAIQDHDLGETMFFSQTQMGKIALELKNFITVAHSKNFLKNVFYRDRTSATVFTYSLAGEAMLYMLQTSVNFAHDPEALAEKLTLDKIASAAIQRSSALGIMPSIASTGYHLGFREDLFGGVGTANTDNRLLWMTPSMLTVQKAYNFSGAAMSSINPFSDKVMTKKDIKDGFGLLPGGNTWGMRNFSDYISEMYPKNQPYREVMP
jgi:hypothetical protein